MILDLDLDALQSVSKALGRANVFCFRLSCRTFALVKHGPTKTPVKHAVVSVAMLDFALRTGCRPSASITAHAARRGDLQVLRHAVQSGCPLDRWAVTYAARCSKASGLRVLMYLKGVECEWDPHACYDAAMYGRLEVLRWLVEACECRVNASTMRIAALYGHFKTVKYLHTIGCPWDFQAYINAARAGHVEMLEFLHDHGCPRCPTAPSHGALGGHVPVLQFLERAQEFVFDEVVFAEGVRGGNHAVLEYLYKIGCPIDGMCLVEAARRDDERTLKWLVDRGCTWDQDACADAAESDDFRLLVRLHKHGAPMDASVCAKAAAAGNLEMLQWLREKNCEWDQWTTAEAAGNGFLHVLQWAWENGCPWDALVYDFLEAGHAGDEIFRFAQEHGCPENFYLA